MKRHLNFCIIAIFASTFAGLSNAAATQLSLEGAVQMALLENRDLAAARFTVQKAGGRLRQAGLLPNPDI